MSVTFMSRPCKKRIIFKEPSNLCFKEIHSDNEERVILNIDEYEVIRLIDYEHFSQEEAAKKMNVARTTVQAIYQDARSKISDFLVNTKILEIVGGNYSLNIKSSFNKKDKSYEAILKEKEKNIMRIALPVLNGEIFQHFGKSEAFEIVDIAEGEVTDRRTVDTNGAGHAALASFLQANEVDLLICGGIGGGAINALTEAGIQIISGIDGKIDDVLVALKNETLESKPSDCGCHHHEHEEGHECCGHHDHHEEGHECCHHHDHEDGQKDQKNHCRCHDK